MANEREPFVLDFPNGQRVEDILKKADQLPTKAQLDQQIAQKAGQSDIQNLQAQIDNIVRAPENPGDVGAEVFQARVGVDGTDYPTLGSRLDANERSLDDVEAEVEAARESSYGTSYSDLETRLNSDFDILTQSTDFENLFDSSTALDNKRLQGSGVIADETGFFTSDLIPVNASTRYIKSGANDVAHRVAFYDSNSVFISDYTGSSFITPEGTTQIRFSGRMSEKDAAYFSCISAHDYIARNAIAELASTCEYEIADTVEKISRIQSEIFTTTDKAIRISDIPTITAVPSNNAAPGNRRIDISENTLFDTYYFITKKPITIWVDSVGVAYYAIAYGLGYTYTSQSQSGLTTYLHTASTITRLRNTDSNLPTASNKLVLPANTAVAFTVTAGTNPEILGLDYDLVTSDTFAEPIVEAACEAASEAAVARLTDSTALVCSSNSEYDNVYDGYYATNVGLTPMEIYISYGLIITADTELYVQSRNGTYLSVCVYDDINFSNGVRYRFMQAGEDTLPYEDNPITVSAGQYVVFSVRKNYPNFRIVLPGILEIASYKGSIPLAPSHIAQIKAEISDAIIIQYSAEPGTSISERVHIYVPTGIGFIEYEFVHNVSVAINSDIWRINYAYACDNQYERLYALTTGGEWEVAVRLQGRDDFSGGVAHGDQVMTDVVFFIDGAAVDITTITDKTPVTKFVVTEASNLYDPADSVTVIAHHGSEHIFTKNGLEIKQSLLWLANQQLAACYMAMHLPAKTVTDSMYTDNSIIPFEIETYPKTFHGSHYAVVYGSESGVRSEFSIGEYPYDMPNGGYLMLTDNGGLAYNKCYYVITTSGSVTADTLWKSDTYYRFDVNQV